MATQDLTKYYLSLIAAISEIKGTEYRQDAAMSLMDEVMEKCMDDEGNFNAHPGFDAPLIVAHVQKLNEKEQDNLDIKKNGCFGKNEPIDQLPPIARDFMIRRGLIKGNNNQSSLNNLPHPPVQNTQPSINDNITQQQQDNKLIQDNYDNNQPSAKSMVAEAGDRNDIDIMIHQSYENDNDEDELERVFNMACTSSDHTITCSQFVFMELYRRKIPNLPKDKRTALYYQACGCDRTGNGKITIDDIKLMRKNYNYDELEKAKYLFRVLDNTRCRRVTLRMFNQVFGKNINPNVPCQKGFMDTPIDFSVFCNIIGKKDAPIGLDAYDGCLGKPFGTVPNPQTIILSDSTYNDLCMLYDEIVSRPQHMNVEEFKTFLFNFFHADIGGHLSNIPMFHGGIDKTGSGDISENELYEFIINLYRSSKNNYRYLSAMYFRYKDADRNKLITKEEGIKFDINVITDDEDVNFYQLTRASIHYDRDDSDDLKDPYYGQLGKPKTPRLQIPRDENYRYGNENVIPFNGFSYTPYLFDNSHPAYTETQKYLKEIDFLEESLMSQRKCCL